MKIDITQTTEKIIKGELGKPNVSINADGEGKYYAKVIFPIKQDGHEIESLELDYSIVDWDYFWTNFNTGGFLVQELKTKYNIGDLVIPNDIENWFINMI